MPIAFPISSGRSVLGRGVALVAAGLLCSALAAQAQTAVLAAPAIPASAAKPLILPATAPAALVAHAVAYKGRFASTCQSLDPNLHFIDSMELTPTAVGPVLDARYRKALYTAANCSPASLLVTLNLPKASWTFNGQASVSGKTVDLVTVIGRAGPITATVAQAGKVQETADRFVVRYGEAGELPISKAMDDANDKVLRLLEDGRLYQGNDAPLAPSGYPAAINLDSFYTRQ